jgi:hypothetical protein
MSAHETNTLHVVFVFFVQYKSKLQVELMSVPSGKRMGGRQEKHLISTQDAARIHMRKEGLLLRPVSIVTTRQVYLREI